MVKVFCFYGVKGVKEGFMPHTDYTDNGRFFRSLRSWSKPCGARCPTPTKCRRRWQSVCRSPERYTMPEGHCHSTQHCRGGGVPPQAGEVPQRGGGVEFVGLGRGLWAVYGQALGRGLERKSAVQSVSADSSPVGRLAGSRISSSIRSLRPRR